MSLHKRRSTKNGKSVSPLKKDPAQKTASKKSKEGNGLCIDIRSSKMNYKALVDLAKRKLTKATKEPMPQDIKPMLATLVDEPFNDNEWLFELKLDGYRTLAYLNGGHVDLRSRNNNSFDEKFRDIYEALKKWKINAVLDGEIVVLNEDGVPDFNGIQQWEMQQRGQLVYYVFDLLWLDGMNIMSEPLYLRREILKQLVPDDGIIRFSDHIDDIGKDFYELAQQNGLEGIIAKKKNAPYLPDTRTKSWLKIKIEHRHEAIICGYTRKRSSDRLFSSLLLGVYQNGILNYIGQVGTGFTDSFQEILMKKMMPLVVKQCPFPAEPETNAPPVWLKPHLVGEVKYTELTNEGLMRHPSFKGLREDKTAVDLNNEKELPVEIAVEEADEDSSLLVCSTDDEMLVNVEGHDLKLSHLKKYYWPKEKITKGDLINYYYSMAEYIMPYMKDRPQSLNRFPNGINGESFYHKNMGGKVDKWLKTFRRFSESSGEPKDFLICTDAASLIYMANLGCIEMNPWHSRVQNPAYPDWSVIDLDPGAIAFEKVIETALVVKDILDSLNIPSWPKTSGSTGMHIYIPLGAKYNYEQSKQLAELVANIVHDELPEFTSIVRNPEKRKDKIYIDYLQNRPIQTICAPYSVRPKPGATVSAPLRWEEVKKGLQISRFTIRNMAQRVKAEGDLFQGVMGKGIDLNKVLKNLAHLI